MSHGYFCVTSRGGQRRFYHNNRPILKKDIPPEHLPDVLAQAKNRDGEKEKTFRLQARLASLIQRKGKLEEEISLLEGLIKNAQNKGLLGDLGIKTIKDWKTWLRANHPDKNPEGDLDLVAKVNNEANKVFR